MKLIAILITMIAFAAIGSAQDYVNFQGIPATELSGLNLSQMGKILGGNDMWMMLGSGQYTASQRAFMADQKEGKIPEGYQPRKAAYLGAPINRNDTRVM